MYSTEHTNSGEYLWGLNLLEMWSEKKERERRRLQNLQGISDCLLKKSLSQIIACKRLSFIDLHAL